MPTFKTTGILQIIQWVWLHLRQLEPGTSQSVAAHARKSRARGVGNMGVSFNYNANLISWALLATLIGACSSASAKGRAERRSRGHGLRPDPHRQWWYLLFTQNGARIDHTLASNTMVSILLIQWSVFFRWNGRRIIANSLTLVSGYVHTYRFVRIRQWCQPKKKMTRKCLLSSKRNIRDKMRWRWICIIYYEFPRNMLSLIQ